MTGTGRSRDDPRQLRWLPDDRGPHLHPEACSIDPSLVAALHPSVRLGTSSWSFPGWEGLIYDRRYSDSLLSQRGLLAYARHPLLRSVGIDRAFYGPIDVEVLQRWAGQVPEDFRFLIKADAKLTSPWGRGPRQRAAPRENGSAHGKAERETMQDACGANPDFLAVEFARTQVFAPALQGLGDKLGCLLLQFPPFDPAHFGGVQALAGRMLDMGRAMDPQVPCAVEFRHPGWLIPDVIEVLVSLNWGFGLVVWPGMPDLRDQLRIAAAACRKRMLIRWMLHAGQTYASAVDRYEPFDRFVDPDPRTRDTVARILLRAIQRGVDESYVIINNKAEGSSPRSVLALAQRLARPPGDDVPERG